MVKNSKSSQSFSKLCTPAKIYFAIAVISVIIGLTKHVPYGILGMKIVFAFIWTYILGWLCKNGHSTISWVLVLLPYIVMILAVLRIANITQHKAIFKSVGLQGAYGEEPYSGMKKMRQGFSMPSINFGKKK
jgi:hypothetical protein